jgi:hypothetical protein
MNTSAIAFAILAVLLFLLLFIPVMMFLVYGWHNRKREIMCLFTESAIRKYFQAFFPAEELGPDGVHAAFERSFYRRFGRRTYAFPAALLFGIVIGAYVFMLTNLGLLASALDKEHSTALLGLSAFFGAYFFIVYEMQRRERSSDLSPFHLNQASLRLLLIVPIAYIFADFFKAEFGYLIAFALGAFPVKELWKVIRDQAKRTLKIGEEEKGKAAGLIELQGVDKAIAERFEIEGITTIEQLAYSDPIDITIRTGIGFSLVSDFISQALAWIYLEWDLPKARRYSLRGALEVKGLFEEIDHDEKDEESVRDAEIARFTLKSLAGELKLDDRVLERSLRSIVDDPHYLFISEIWLERVKNA